MASIKVGPANYKVDLEAIYEGVLMVNWLSLQSEKKI